MSHVQSQNNISFGAKIKILNAYEELLPKDNVVNVDLWNIDGAKFCSRGVSTSASVCTIGHLRNDAEGFLFHLVPDFDKDNMKKVAQVIGNAHDRLRGHSRVKGFFVGAKSNSKASMSYAKFVLDTVKDLNVPFSAMLGLKKGLGASLFCDVTSDSYIVTTNTKKITNMLDLRLKYKILKKRFGDSFYFT